MTKSRPVNSRPGLLVASVVAVATMALPIVLAIVIANEGAREAEIQRARSLAEDIIARSDRTADQVDAGIRKLLANQQDNPCSDSNRRLMWQITLSSSSIQAIGYVQNDRMVCSSLFDKGDSFDLGPPDVVQPSGVRLRYNVRLPFAPNDRFLVIEEMSYAAVINKDIPIDVTTDSPGTVLATVSRVQGRVLASRGELNPAWLKQFDNVEEAAFVDDGYVVSVVPSKRYFIGAIAALPIEGLNERTKATAAILVPVGLAAGIILFLVFAYLLRLQGAMPAVLKAALRRREFFMLYQPVVDLTTGSWTGAEALIRWRRSNGDLVRPDLFIPAVEDSGLAQRLTEHVVELVERDAGRTFDRYPNFHLAVNLSPSDLRSLETVGLLSAFASRLGAVSKNLIVEATERGFMNAQETSEVLRQIRAAGIRVAIDDFGTGYSSLAYLEKFEVDFLKIDKSFVDTVGTEAATSHVIGHIIEMAKSLNLEMIAEGVETEEQAAYLRERGVQYAQGWLFGKPMTYEELMAGVGKNKELGRNSSSF